MRQIDPMKPPSNDSTTEKYRTKQRLGQPSCHLLALQTYMLIWKLSLPKCNLRMAQGM